MTQFRIRDVVPEDITPLAAIWHQQWMHAHAQYVPEDLTLLRTLEDFCYRLRAFGTKAQTAGPIGAPLGFFATVGAELDQIYVDKTAIGTGLADALLRSGEARISAEGHSVAHLVCIKENQRAQAFYRRHNWKLQGQTTAMLSTSVGEFPLETLSFMKILSTGGGKPSINHI